MSTKKLTLKDIQATARKHGGKCLDKKYINARSQMTFKCRHGHIFTTAVSNIRAGCFCPVCGNKNKGANKRLPIKDIKALAKQKGGKLLSKEYKNLMTPLKWECSNGHKFDDTLHAVKRRAKFCKECRK